MMTMYNGDTIAAVSTPPGKGGVALIRCSGPDAFQIVDACFTAKNGKKVADFPLRHAVYGYILRDGEVIDDGILTLFPAESSYTGEPVAEFSCHGGLLVTKTVLSSFFAAGARPAEAGEFTRRAFLNGRLSLTDAEAIGSLLEAQTEEQIKISSVKARHRLRHAISDITEKITHLVSNIYALIDFPDEDLAEMTDKEIAEELQEILNKLTSLSKTYHTGRAISEGVDTVICGKPNVGKSSLYNALCGEELAIVTAIAGTTRDLLSETVSLGRIKLRLTDTAGLRHEKNDTDIIDAVEKIGIRRAEDRLADAELIIAVFDASNPLTGEDEALIDRLSSSDKTVIAVLNKCDLPSKIHEAEIRKCTPHVVTLSAKNHEIDTLRALIETLCTDASLSAGSDAILFDARQFSAVSRAAQAVKSSKSAFDAGLPADVAFQDLELAIGALEELDGRGVSSALVDHIFSRFCVGK